MNKAYLATLIILALTVVSSGIIGGFSQAALNAISIVLMVAVIFSVFSFGNLRGGHFPLALVGSVLAVSWMVLFPSQGNDSRLIVLVVFCFCLAREQGQSDSSFGTLYTILGLSALTIFGASLIYHSEPLLWYSVQTLATTFSSATGKLTGQTILLGSTATGLLVSFVFILFGFYVSVVTKSSRILVTYLLYVLFIAALNALFVSIVHPAARWIQSAFSDVQAQPMNMLWLLPLLDLVPSYWLLRRVRASLDQVDFVPIKWIPFGAALGCLVLWGAISWRPSWEKEYPLKEILMYDKGYINWDKPVFGRYGMRGSGMFGMLPSFLEVMGYRAKRDSVLTDDNLRNVGVVVVINLNKRMREDEKTRIQAFVSDGGSLLVLGDHTDLAGIMGPLNDAIDFVKVRYRFDCGHYLRKDWRESFEFWPHPIFAGVKDEIDVGISVGASLDCSPLNGRPVLVAKYGFSDRGDPKNEKNAYLGDRRYNAGELLGDIMLIAEASYGKGKVLIFGDTSPFQNGALVYSFDFVQNVFEYLLTTERSWSNMDLRILSFLFLIVGFGIPVFVSLRFGQAGTALWIAVILWIVGAMISTRERSVRNVDAYNHPVAYIDASQLNRFSQYGDDGVWALTYHLMRNGYMPVVRREFSSDWLRRSSVAFFISPAKPVSVSVLEEVDSYVGKGGVAVWAFGYEEKEAVEKVMTKYGFDLDNVPLGPIPETESNLGVWFHKAWPIVIGGNGAFDTLCTGWGYPVIVGKTIGQGKVSIVSDPGFFLGENVELNHTSPKSNALFLEIVSKTQISKVPEATQAGAQ